MTVIDPGHYFSLLRLDTLKGGDLTLRFVKRQGTKYPGNTGSYPGTTLQEVLRACISRTKYLHKQAWHWTNLILLVCLHLAVWMLEIRAAIHHGRRIPGVHAAVYGPVCVKCLHVGCKGSCHT